MRINDLHSTGASAAETGRAQGSQQVDRDGATSPASARGGSGPDHVDLSPLSRALHAGGVAHHARIHRLAGQYRSGQYQVDPAQLSHAMVSDALQASAAKP